MCYSGLHTHLSRCQYFYYEGYGEEQLKFCMPVLSGIKLPQSDTSKAAQFYKTPNDSENP